MKPTRITLWKVFTLLSFMAWFTLLSVGITVNSKYYLDRVSRVEGKDMIFDLGALWMVMLSYTPTNVALLAVFAGLTGGLTSNLAANSYFRLTGQQKLTPDSPDFQRLVYLNESPLVAAMRGFMVYLLFVAGANLSLTSDANVKSTTIFNMAAESRREAVDDSLNRIMILADSTLRKAEKDKAIRELASEKATHSDKQAPELYFKFSLTISLLAFLVGFDPSMLSNWLNNLPFAGLRNPSKGSQPPRT